jgi:CRP-like cAMP-binding protein
VAPAGRCARAAWVGSWDRAAHGTRRQPPAKQPHASGPVSGHHRRAPAPAPLPRPASHTTTQTTPLPPQEGPLAQGLDAAAAAAGLERFSAQRALEPGAVLFDFDEPPREIYLTLSGAVDVSIKHFADTIVDRTALEEHPSLGAAPAAAAGAASPSSGGGGGGGKPGRPPRAPAAAAGGAGAAAAPAKAERQYCCGPGSVFGGTDFVLQRPRSFRAVVSAPTRVVAIGREQYRQCVRSAPEAAAFLQASAAAPGAWRAALGRGVRGGGKGLFLPSGCEADAWHAASTPVLLTPHPSTAPPPGASLLPPPPPTAPAPTPAPFPSPAGDPAAGRLPQRGVCL